MSLTQTLKQSLVLITGEHYDSNYMEYLMILWCVRVGYTRTHTCIDETVSPSFLHDSEHLSRSSSQATFTLMVPSCFLQER